MLPIRHCRFTGASRGKSDSPVQVGLASWCAAHGHASAFVSYLHTDQPILWSAQKVHGISTLDLADAPPLLALWPELHSRLAGSVVVAHGKGTEKRFLRTFPGHGFGPWIDTLLLARAAWPELTDHSLGALCGCHNLTVKIQALVALRSWHDALFDAVASLVLLAHVIESHALADEPLDTLLYPDTSRWHRRRRS